MGCKNCIYKGLPVADPKKRCTRPDRTIDISTLAIVGGYVCSCDKFEPKVEPKKKEHNAH